VKQVIYVVSFLLFANMVWNRQLIDWTRNALSMRKK
jgi:hypothetical protein